MKQTIKVYLKSVLLKETGDVFNLKGNHILSVFLSFPRPGINRIEHYVKLPLPGDKVEKLQSNELYETRLANPEDKLLLWQEFEPTEETGLKVSINIVKEKSDGMEILKKVANSVGVAILGLATGGAGVTIAVAAGKTLIEVAMAEQKKEKITPFAKSTSWYYENIPSSEELTFHLATEKKLTFSVGPKIIDDKKVTEVHEFPKGYIIGTVVLAVERSPFEAPESGPAQPLA